MDKSVEDLLFQQYYKDCVEIGSGSFGKVYKCINKMHREEVAVKVLNKESISKSKAIEFLSEAKILSQLDHPHIVKMKEWNESPQNIMLEMELLKGGTLESRISNGAFSENDAATVMRGLLSAVHYLHQHDIIHRDIKPENIMFADDSLQSVRVTDFGLSSQWALDYIGPGLDESVGTIIYMAPEQTGSKLYSKPVDIWSCGILMYILIAGKHPLMEPKESVRSYLRKLENPHWKFPANFSDSAKHLFLKLTHVNPLQRYTAEQALRHPWVTREADKKPPLTYLERITQFNDKLKLRGLLQATIYASYLITNSGIKLQNSYIETLKNPQKNVQKLVPSEAEMPKISMTFSTKTNSRHYRRFNSMKINRSPSPTRCTSPPKKVRRESFHKPNTTNSWH
ncbi:unnamed protein product [Blepharisma stoltei]|uniref:Protein kinase domain-containing protein n=1 Tax=Blepharisma stoltei TaxID=1481888 RepID=A0AAU9JW69_9CILI|nr:unnamed protein product [Blepharisma stoltei]